VYRAVQGLAELFLESIGLGEKRSGGVLGGAAHAAILGAAAVVVLVVLVRAVNLFVCAVVPHTSSITWLLVVSGTSPF
jgi:hypothetical protein